MRILIDIGHPAHVHLFKYFAHEMIRKGHSVHFTVRDKEFEIALLKNEGFSFTNLGQHYKSKIGKIWGLIKYTWLIIIVSIKYNPDIYLSHGSIYTAFASIFLRKINIALEDTGNWEQVRLYKPFTKAILTGKSFSKSYGSKQIYYDGYHELAYLHPKYFKADSSVKISMGLKEKDRYFILRFVSWEASHDMRQAGLSIIEKRNIVNYLKQFGHVFISAESTLDAEFEPYRLSLPPEKIHSVLYYADLFIGEGATMASECAILGAPAVYINSMEAGSIKEQEDYGLLFHFKNGKGVLEKIKDLLKDEKLKERISKARVKLLSEKIDVTSFLIWFMEEYPNSFNLLKREPSYQDKFK
ncbi:MAG: DUF354 domain-containing protein [Ignavibacteria bacterium]|jgi:predicted glycosyltransferase|nr:DUF354 domain-containing protein [Ignavibacteria bacterium]